MTGKALAGAFMVGAGLVGLASMAAAQDAVLKNPSECEISAALLGQPAPGCPPVQAPGGKRNRGLAIGSMEQMTPPAPEPSARPQPDAGTPAPATAKADAPARPAPAELKAAFQINFDFGSATIRPDSKAVLDRVANVMNSPAGAGVTFRVVGHTDSVGTDEANLDLSRQRAEAVVEYLVSSHKIAADRLKAVGMGKREPLNKAKPAAPENRRVEIINLSS